MAGRRIHLDSYHKERRVEIVPLNDTLGSPVWSRDYGSSLTAPEALPQRYAQRRDVKPSRRNVTGEFCTEDTKCSRVQCDQWRKGEGSEWCGLGTRGHQRGRRSDMRYLSAGREIDNFRMYGNIGSGRMTSEERKPEAESAQRMVVMTRSRVGDAIINPRQIETSSRIERKRSPLEMEYRSSRNMSYHEARNLEPFQKEFPRALSANRGHLERANTKSAWPLSQSTSSVMQIANSSSNLNPPSRASRNFMRGRTPSPTSRRDMSPYLGEEVILNVYDISNGKAAQWSQSMIGTHIDGIWHSGVSVFGFEYFYCVKEKGCGVSKMREDTVSSVFSMTLMHTHSLGRTKKTRKAFETFLLANMYKFAPENYDLMNWNCNHFSEMAVDFLFPPKSKYGFRSRMPHYVMDQTRLIESTARGRVVVWAIKNILQRAEYVLDGTLEQGLAKIAAA